MLEGEEREGLFDEVAGLYEAAVRDEQRPLRKDRQFIKLKIGFYNNIV